MSKNLKTAIVSSTLALVLSASGCTVDISENIPDEVFTTPVPAASAEATSETVVTSAPATHAVTTTPKVVVTTTTAETTVTTTTERTETEPLEEEIIDDEVYKTYVFSDEYNEFIDQCVFVGDSICSGLKAYEILPAKQVVAQGNVAARNIFDFTFKVDGDEMSVLSALVNLKPKYVVFSMGMNDVNITSEEAFCENYGNLLTLTEGFLPDSTLIVCSVTPILSTSKFTSNTNIDNFNAKLKEYLDESEKWIYVDIARDMKNDLNSLKTNYNGGDGIHLAPDAYKAILFQICERMVDGKTYDEEGNVVYLTAEETEEPETSVQESETEETSETSAFRTTAHEETTAESSEDTTADTTVSAG